MNGGLYINSNTSIPSDCVQDIINLVDYDILPQVVEILKECGVYKEENENNAK